MWKTLRNYNTVHDSDISHHHHSNMAIETMPTDTDTLKHGLSTQPI